MIDLTGKVAFIANADHPAAAACTGRLQAAGAKVCGAGSASADLAVDLDPYSPDSWDSAFDRCKTELGGLDVLVIPTGATASEGILSLAPEDFVAAHRSLAVTAFLAQNRGILAMRASGIEGAVIHILPAAARAAAGDAAAACTASAGILFSSKSAALECAKAKDGIVVNAILAGPIEGEEPLNYGVPVDPVSPDDIASAVLFFAAEGAAYMTGMDLPVDNGLVAQ